MTHTRLYDLPLALCASLFQNWLTLGDFAKLKTIAVGDESVERRRKNDSTSSYLNLLRNVIQNKDFVIRHYSKKYPTRFDLNACCNQDNLSLAFNWLRLHYVKSTIFYGPYLCKYDEIKWYAGHTTTIHLDFDDDKDFQQPSVDDLAEFLNGFPLLTYLRIVDFTAIGDNLITKLDYKSLQNLEILVLYLCSDSTSHVTSIFAKCLAANCKSLREFSMLSKGKRLPDDDDNGVYLTTLIDNNKEQLQKIKLCYNGCIYNDEILRSIQRLRHIRLVCLHFRGVSRFLNANQFEQVISLVCAGDSNGLASVSVFIHHETENQLSFQFVNYPKHGRQKKVIDIACSEGSVMKMDESVLCASMAKLFIACTDFDEIRLDRIRVDAGIIKSITEENGKLQNLRCEFAIPLNPIELNGIIRQLRSLYRRNNFFYTRMVLNGECFTDLGWNDEEKY